MQQEELLHFGGLSGVLHAGVAVAVLALVAASVAARNLITRSWERPATLESL